MKKTLMILAGVGGLMAASIAAAQPPGPPAGGPGHMGPGGPGHMGRMGPGHGGMMMFDRVTPEERKKIRADAFARMDSNRDGKVSFEEFRADLERRKLERERMMFNRFSGGQDSFTLEQLNARSAERFGGRFEGRGEGRGFRGGPDGQGGRRFGPGGPPPAPPAPPAR